LFFQSGNEFILGGYATSFLTTDSKVSDSAASYLLAGYWGSIMLARVFLSRFLLKAKGSTAVLISATVAAIGVITLVSGSGVWGAALGLVLIGVGFASIFPTTLGAAGARFAGRSGTVFGILIAIALSGGMTLPWLVGHLARDYGLRWALLVAVFNCLMIFGLQLAVRKKAN
jgi:fucose permease